MYKLLLLLQARKFYRHYTTHQFNYENLKNTLERIFNSIGLQNNSTPSKHFNSSFSHNKIFSKQHSNKKTMERKKKSTYTFSF